LSKSKVLWQQCGLYVAFSIALTGTLGSLYYSEVAGFVPCTLCWYERILMYPLALITLIGIVKQDEGVADYVLPLSILGIGISTYHYLLQLGVFPHEAVCSIGIPCDLRYVSYGGFVTIPLMAWAAFVVITGVAIASKWSQARAEMSGQSIDY
jgi:disulfide bond formation protein DsbB